MTITNILSTTYLRRMADGYLAIAADLYDVKYDDSTVASVTNDAVAHVQRDVDIMNITNDDQIKRLLMRSVIHRVMEFVEAQ